VNGSRDTPSVGADDAIIALTTLALTIGAAAIRPAGSPSGISLVAVAAAMGPCAALVVRRRWPLAVLAISVAAWLIAAYAGERLAGVFPIAVALYTVALRCGRTWAVATWAAVTFLVTASGPPFATRPVDMVGLLPFGLLAGSALGATTLYGLYQASRRAHLAALEERAHRLEREHALVAARAIAEERMRIAHELHDVVAHHVSVMVIQAGAAGEVLPSDAGPAREAIESVRRSGREALGELRRLLDVLRADEPSPSPDRAPQPGLAALDDLVERVAEAGLDVNVAVSGDAASLPAGVDLSAYRIIQEALTNTLRYGGAGTHAGVSVDYLPDEVRIAVVDDGRGSGPGIPGHGLIGMRERAAILGGEVVAAPGPSGGFRVTARLPIDHAGHDPDAIDRAGRDPEAIGWAEP
jgi:signal transduction histidine kinase